MIWQDYFGFRKNKSFQVQVLLLFDCFQIIDCVQNLNRSISVLASGVTLYLYSTDNIIHCCAVRITRVIEEDDAMCLRRSGATS